MSFDTVYKKLQENAKIKVTFSRPDDTYTFSVVSLVKVNGKLFGEITSSSYDSHFRKAAAKSYEVKWNNDCPNEIKWHKDAKMSSPRLANLKERIVEFLTNNLK